MRIAIPEDALVAPIVARAETVCAERGWTLRTSTEQGCAELLANNLVDVALVSPLAYGRAAGVVDYNIVPGPCVALVDFTNTAGIYFTQNIATITHIGAENPDNFMEQMGVVILRERYEAEAAAVLTLERDSIAADCIVARPTEDGPTATLDVSEEFSDLAECPLPAYLWVCRLDADVSVLPEALTDMADQEIVEHTVEEHVHLCDDHFVREGRIHYRWSDDVEEGLLAVLNLLYFHQRLPNLPDIKLLKFDA